mmetsp:Transcript_38990/g.107349  ORF Transcript_38990/g.107349 Transcript_38990/m.107349 type:complete len:216 (-) Transcript_38990:220-867(-)
MAMHSEAKAVSPGNWAPLPTRSVSGMDLENSATSIWCPSGRVCRYGFAGSMDASGWWQQKQMLSFKSLARSKAVYRATDSWALGRRASSTRCLANAASSAESKALPAYVQHRKSSASTCPWRTIAAELRPAPTSTTTPSTEPKAKALSAALFAYAAAFTCKRSKRTSATTVRARGHWTTGSAQSTGRSAPSEATTVPRNNSSSASASHCGRPPSL